ncbi:hypothetical protein [Poriferisphaera corsica]|nr:hypothetical protein [Poriferisphaera corsica]
MPKNDMPITPLMIHEPIQCASCDYNLLNLSTDSNCPECGLAINESLAEYHNTTQHAVITALFRLLMVYCFIVYIFPMIVQIFAAFLTFILPQQSTALVAIDVSFQEFIMFGGMHVTSAVFIIMLFYYAPAIVNKIFKPRGRFILGPGLTAPKLMTVGLTLIGAYITFAAIIKLIYLFYGIAYQSFGIGDDTAQLSYFFPSGGSDLMYAIPYIFQFILGLVIILGKHGLANFIHKLRNAGTRL